MIHTIKTTVRALAPKGLFTLYHTLLTSISAWQYGFPSRKLVVIAVTGTNGKSTTCMLIADLLKAAGYSVGLASSVMFRVGDTEWINTTKMTMLGRGALQKLLARMVVAGCQYAVVEVSSEGLAQGRLAGLDVDVAVFTNLTPEHIESHGSFEKYKKAKGILFASLARAAKKTLKGTRVQKVIIANTDDEHAPYYLSFKADKKVGFGQKVQSTSLVSEFYRLDNLIIKEKGASFELNQNRIQIGLEGMFNIYNAACAYATLASLGISTAKLGLVLAEIHGLPGRMEWIDEGQDYDVLVDYAPEPASLAAVYEYINQTRAGAGKIIHVLGSAGGGRDVARRPILGQMAGKNADIVIVSNEDPYDEDPATIIEQVAAGARLAGKKEGTDLFLIQDRQSAINTAMNLAKKGDLVLLTGKGAEQVIASKGGTKLPWDEREAARSAIKLAAQG